MGRAEVDELYARMRAANGSRHQPHGTVPAPVAVLAAPPAPTPPQLPVQQQLQPDDAGSSWPTVDAFSQCAARGSTVLLDAAPAARRAELQRLRALVEVRQRSGAVDSTALLC